MRRLRDLHEDERGTTLMELLVGMAVLTVFMAIFTTAMLTMTNTVSKVQSVTSSAGQVNTAFLQLDKTLRYATGISPIGTGNVGGETHVEFAMIEPTDVTRCHQLRIVNATLQQRTWDTPDPAGSTYSNLSAWVTLASNVSTDGSSSFSVPAAISGATSSYQQLTVRLQTDSGSNVSSPTKTFMTFTAVNSDIHSTAAVCQQVPVDATS
jgi:hypothetical protein